MASEEALEEIEHGKLRRPLAHNQSFGRTDTGEGGSASFHKLVNRESAPRWRGQAIVLDVDWATVAANFQGQTFRVAR